MYMIYSNQYAIEFVAYLLVLIVHFVESIIYILFSKYRFNRIFFKCKFLVQKSNRSSVFYVFSPTGNPITYSFLKIHSRLEKL